MPKTCLEAKVASPQSEPFLICSTGALHASLYPFALKGSLKRFQYMDLLQCFNILVDVPTLSLETMQVHIWWKHTALHWRNKESQGLALSWDKAALSELGCLPSQRSSHRATAQSRELKRSEREIKTSKGYRCKMAFRLGRKDWSSHLHTCLKIWRKLAFVTVKYTNHDTQCVLGRVGETDCWYMTPFVASPQSPLSWC